MSTLVFCTTGTIAISLFIDLLVELCETFIRYQTAVTQPHVCWVPRVVYRRWRGRAAKTDHSPLSSTKVKNEWSCTSIPPYVFMVCKGSTFCMDSASWSSDWYPCFVVWSSQAVFELRRFGVLSEHYRKFRLSLMVKCFDEIFHKRSKSVTDNHTRIRHYPV